MASVEVGNRSSFDGSTLKSSYTKSVASNWKTCVIDVVRREISSTLSQFSKE